MTHPIALRAIIAYALLAEFFIEARKFTIEEYDACVKALGWKQFDFRKSPKAIEDAVVQRHLESTRRYVHGRLRAQFKTLHAAAPV